MSIEQRQYCKKNRVLGIEILHLSVVNLNSYNKFIQIESILSNKRLPMIRRKFKNFCLWKKKKIRQLYSNKCENLLCAVHSSSYVWLVKNTKHKK